MSRLFFFPVFLGVLILLAVAALPASPAQAAGSTITVNIPQDRFGGSKFGCSLREAIQTANTNLPFGGIPGATFNGCVTGSSSGVDTIVFDPLAGNTYTLTRNNPGGVPEDANATGDLDITDPNGLIIDGNGPSGLSATIIEANFDGYSSNDRLFDVRPGVLSGVVKATIRDVTVQNGGYPGGYPDVNGAGILNAGTMELNNSIVTSNWATSFGGGIFNDTSGTANIINTTVGPENRTDPHTPAGSGGGGGIYNQGTMTLTGSTVKGNHADNDRGGGIYNLDQTLTVTNSIIGGDISTGNQALNGGGIFNRYGTVTLEKVETSFNTATDNGGGIFNYGGTTTIENSTISSNQALTAAGISTFTGGATTELNFATVAHNKPLPGGIGGGVVSTGLTRVKNTIIFYNRLNSFALFGFNCLGNVVSDGYNLTPAPVPISPNNPPCNGFTKTGDQNWASAGLDSMLRINGDPFKTKTHALLPASKAINKADPLTPCPLPAPKRDQRGFGRPNGAACDIGAYERMIVLVPWDDPNRQFAPVGGTVELLTGDPAGPGSVGGGSGEPEVPYAALAGGMAAGVLALAAGGWYARRRWMR